MFEKVIPHLFADRGYKESIYSREFLPGIRIGYIKAGKPVMEGEEWEGMHEEAVGNIEPQIITFDWPNMCAITVKGINFGAAGILCDGVLDRACDLLDCGELVLIPSSTNEIIVFPQHSNDGVQELSAIIREINKYFVEAGEVLGERPYLYCKKTKEIKWKQ